MTKESITKTEQAERNTAMIDHIYTTPEMIQGKRSEKTQAGVDAARLIRTMEHLIDDECGLSDDDKTEIANVYYVFVDKLPKEAQEELRHG